MKMLQKGNCGHTELCVHQTAGERYHLVLKKTHLKLLLLFHGSLACITTERSQWRDTALWKGYDSFYYSSFLTFISHRFFLLLNLLVIHHFSQTVFFNQKNRNQMLVQPLIGKIHFKAVLHTNTVIVKRQRQFPLGSFTTFKSLLGPIFQDPREHAGSKLMGQN